MRDYIAEANKFMYDDNYIVEAKFEVQGKEYPSKQAAEEALKSKGLSGSSLKKTLANGKFSKKSESSVKIKSAPVKTVEDVINAIGPRGEVGERAVIAFLKKNKMSGEKMADVIGHYGIDGEEYFDDNGNWKDNTASNEKSFHDVDVDDDDGFDVVELKKAAKLGKYVKVPDHIDMDELMDSYRTGFKTNDKGYYPAKYILKHLQSAY